MRVQVAKYHQQALSAFFNFNHSLNFNHNLAIVLTCICLMKNCVTYAFQALRHLHTFFFLKHLYRYVHYLLGMYVLINWVVEEVLLYILNINPLSDVCIINILSRCDLPFFVWSFQSDFYNCDSTHFIVFQKLPTPLYPLNTLLHYYSKMYMFSSEN